jgi:hypothetical protein
VGARASAHYSTSSTGSEGRVTEDALRDPAAGPVRSVDDGDGNDNVMGQRSVRSAESHRSTTFLDCPVRSAVWGPPTKEIR